MATAAGVGVGEGGMTTVVALVVLRCMRLATQIGMSTFCCLSFVVADEHVQALSI